MNKLRIVFMGTPSFAVAILDKLIEENMHVVGVITAPDKPAGRGQKFKSSEVKKYAEQKNLPLLQPSNLKDPDFLDALKAWQANFQVVVAFRMLPKVVWNMPEFGTINLHASLLPDYRGAAPIHWAIINGEKETGVSTFFIDEKIDTGEVILQEKVKIDPDTTVGILHDELMHIGANTTVATLKLIESGTHSRKKQPKNSDKTAYKLNRTNCRIDWTAHIDKIYNHIRGLNPFPSAWTELHNGEQVLSVKIFDIKKEIAQHNFDQGKIIVASKTIKIAVNGGYIEVISLQMPGKKRLLAKDLLNGFQLDKKAFFK